MRQAIGSTWIMQLVIVFMLIFVAFLALTINYTKAYKIKNEVISVLEKYEGPNSGEDHSISIINNYLKYNGYHSVGTCSDDSFGATSLDSSTLVPVNNGDKYYYCIRRTGTSTETFPDRVSYELEAFFKFNLPLLGDIFTFRVIGETIDINWPNDDITMDSEYSNKWTPSSSSQGKPSSGNSGTSSKTYYTVSFDLNGGTSQKKTGVNTSAVYGKGIASQKVLAGSLATKPSDPYYYTTSRNDPFDHGATFVGWTLNGAPYDFSTPVRSNITLKASWASKIRVTFNYGQCGMREYDEDRKRTHTYGAVGAELGNVSHGHYYNYGDVIGSNPTLYEGSRYDDNQYNHEFNYQITFGYARPIRYWTSNGQRVDLNAPLTKDMILEAVC